MRWQTVDASGEFLNFFLPVHLPLPLPPPLINVFTVSPQSFSPYCVSAQNAEVNSHNPLQRLFKWNNKVKAYIFLAIIEEVVRKVTKRDRYVLDDVASCENVCLWVENVKQLSPICIHLILASTTHSHTRRIALLDNVYCWALYSNIYHLL